MLKSQNAQPKTAVLAPAQLKKKRAQVKKSYHIPMNSYINCILLLEMAMRAANFGVFEYNSKHRHNWGYRKVEY